MLHFCGFEAVFPTTGAKEGLHCFPRTAGKEGVHCPPGAPRWCGEKESACQCRRHKRCRFDPWVGKMPWRRKWQPTRVFLPGESHGQRNLVGYRPWGRRDSGMTEHTAVSGRHLTKCDLRAGVGSIGSQSPQGPCHLPCPTAGLQCSDPFI